MILLSILSSSKSPIIIKCLFFSLWDFKWIIVLDFFVILCFQIGYNIYKDLFLKLALHISCIVIFCKIMSPFIDHRHDKVTYMLCIFKRTLSGGCQRSMIKLPTVYPCALKFVSWKARAISNWYLLIVNVLEVFNSNMWWWYWKFLDMGIIGMTFLGRPSNFMFCNFMLFSMKLSKLIKTFTKDPL